MRQFNINEGVGHPTRQDDFEFMFEALKQAIKGLASAHKLGDRDSFIISGCNITHDTNNSVYDVTEGWFCHKGEIMKVDAHQVSDSASNYVISIPVWCDFKPRATLRRSMRISDFNSSVVRF